MDGHEIIDQVHTSSTSRLYKVLDIESNKMYMMKTTSVNFSYESPIKHNPMIPLWMDGAIHKSVKKDYRSRYATFSEFSFDLTHPNPAFMKYSAPLVETNPTLVWQLISTFLLATNPGWLLYSFA